MIAMEELTIRRYQEMIDRWVNSVGVRYFSELTNTADVPLSLFNSG